MKQLPRILAVLLFSFGLANAAQAQCNLSAIVQDSSWSCADTSSWVWASPTGGTAPYQYVWSNGTTGSNTWAMRPGITSVTITDAQGCTAVASVSLAPASPAPTITHTVTRQGCSGNGLGAAVDLTLSGGMPPFTFVWSNGETNEDAQNLPANPYVYVYDTSGCMHYYNASGITGIPIYQPWVNPASCSQNNGSAQVYASGNYSYLWSNGASTMQATGLAAGWYAVTVSQIGGTCSIVQDMQVGYDPNCETTISGTIYNATVAGCVTNAPVMTVGYVRATMPNGNFMYAPVDVLTGEYELRSRTPGAHSLTYISYYGNTNLSIVCPNSSQLSVITSASGGTMSGNDFFIAYPNTHDVSIDLNMGGAAPGFSHWQNMLYCNNGGAAASGTIMYNYDATILPALPTIQNNYYYYGNAGTSGTLTMTSSSAANGTINFSFSNLQPGACRAVSFYWTVPANVSLLGQTLTSIGTITLNGTDSYIPNNTDTSSTVIVGSYDPNDKRMSEHRTGDDFEGGIYEGDTNFEYIIRFQNTGTAPARRVVVRDTMESNLLIETINSIALSHNGTAHIENGNILVVDFPQIYLPDSTTDLEGSQGYIKFNIQRQAGLALGTSIENRAAIYFDFNEPVITNYAISTIEEIAQSVENLENRMSVQVMPNPFGSYLEMRYELQNSSKVQVRLMNALGQVVVETAPAQQAAGTQQIQLATQNLSAGIYWLQIESSEGKFVQKVIKQ